MRLATPREDVLARFLPGIAGSAGAVVGAVAAVAPTPDPEAEPEPRPDADPGEATHSCFTEGESQADTVSEPGDTCPAMVIL